MNYKRYPGVKMVSYNRYKRGNEIAYLDYSKDTYTDGHSREITLPPNPSRKTVHRLEHGTDCPLSVLATQSRYGAIDRFCAIHPCFVDHRAFCRP